jgi:hypothetical protein
VTVDAGNDFGGSWRRVDLGSPLSFVAPMWLRFFGCRIGQPQEDTFVLAIEGRSVGELASEIAILTSVGHGQVDQGAQGDPCWALR